MNHIEPSPSLSAFDPESHLSYAENGLLQGLLLGSAELKRVLVKRVLK